MARNMAARSFRRLLGRLAKESWPPQRVLITRKTSRLEYERMRHPEMSDRELKDMLAIQGSDYEGLLQRHRLHSRCVENIILSLQRRGVEVLLRNKETLNDSDVQWAELVLAAGGDGNFLRTASKIQSQNKMVVGINTDPTRSEGFLCVSSQYSVEQIIDALLTGRFKVLHRQRIQVDLSGEQLPYLALNEVFIGETDPSHMCYHEVYCDNTVPIKQRSSGLLAYTGTGSTSWAYNVHKMSPHQVHDILSIAGYSSDITTTNKVVEQYNQRCVFASNDHRLAYIVREPLTQGAHNSGLCDRISVRSRSWNSMIIMDGQVSYGFTNGSVAHMSIRPHNALLTCRELT